jgi:hypothetical protein
MNSSFALWHLGVGFVIATAAFGFSLKAASRYVHPGVTLLCASLGIEALGSLLSFFLVVLDPGKSSFLLWSSGVLRYIGLGLLLGGWITLAVSRKPIVVRETGGVGAIPPMISGASFVGWGIVAVLVLSLLAASWTFLSIFAAGMKTVPRFTGGEALSSAVPSLVLLPISIGLSVLGVRWAVGKIFVAFGIVSSLINIACALLTAVCYWAP